MLPSVPTWAKTVLKGLVPLRNKAGQAGYWYKCATQYSVDYAGELANWLRDVYPFLDFYISTNEGGRYIKIVDPANFDLVRGKLLSE